MKIYGASKVWHAPLWKDIRSQGFDITGRWIDYTDDSYIVTHCKDILWQHCLEDVTAADAVIIYCGDSEEEQRGVIMEAGHAIGQGKPVYCINSCKTFAANAISDVAFTHHRLWNWVGDGLSFYDGFRQAYWRAANYAALATETNLKLVARRSA